MTMGDIDRDKKLSILTEKIAFVIIHFTKFLFGY